MEAFAPDQERAGAADGEGNMDSWPPHPAHACDSFLEGAIGPMLVQEHGPAAVALPANQDAVPSDWEQLLLFKLQAELQELLEGEGERNTGPSAGAGH